MNLPTKLTDIILNLWSRRQKPACKLFHNSISIFGFHNYISCITSLTTTWLQVVNLMFKLTPIPMFYSSKSRNNGKWIWFNVWIGFLIHCVKQDSRYLYCLYSVSSHNLFYKRRVFGHNLEEVDVFDWLSDMLIIGMNFVEKR